MRPPERDPIAELKVYPNGVREDRLLVNHGLSVWTREFARAADRPHAVAIGYGLAAGAKLLLTFPAMARIQHAQRDLVAAGASDELAWLSDWIYVVALPSSRRRQNLRVTKDERSDVASVQAVAGLSLTNIATLATIAILVQTSIVPGDLGRAMFEELRRFKAALDGRAARAEEYARVAAKREPAAPCRVTWDDVLA